jgi:hypothetical protein
MWRFLSGDATTRQGFSSEITAWIGILRANLSAKQKPGFAISRIRGYRRRRQGAAARAADGISICKKRHTARLTVFQAGRLYDYDAGRELT